MSGYHVSAEVGGTWEMIPEVLTFDTILTQSAKVPEDDVTESSTAGNMSDISLPENESDMVNLLKIIVDTMDMSKRSDKEFVFVHFSL